jgi:hypothetical protein
MGGVSDQVGSDCRALQIAGHGSFRWHEQPSSASEPRGCGAHILELSDERMRKKAKGKGRTGGEGRQVRIISQRLQTIRAVTFEARLERLFWGESRRSPIRRRRPASVEDTYRQVKGRLDLKVSDLGAVQTEEHP